MIVLQDGYRLNPLRLSILPGKLAVCRMEQHAAVPAWATAGDFFSVTRTPAELSIVCSETLAPQGTQVEGGWRGLQVIGPLDFALTGILAGLAGSLARAGISLFAISTYDTDYILVREKDLPLAVTTLKEAGYDVT